MCLSTAVQAAKRFASSTTDVGVGTAGVDVCIGVVKGTQQESD